MSRSVAGSSHNGRMTIGAVLARLKPDFPDISISKIRFLESEGLIAPSRTHSGYRAFAEEDLSRLEYILAAQRDRFWPLKVIREALEAMDRGLQPPESDVARPRVPTVAADPSLPSPEDLRAGPSDLRLTREEVARTCGLTLEMIDALCTYGLLRPGPDGHFAASSLAVASAAAALAGYGVEARHLRPFRTAADREIGLVQQILSPLRGDRAEDRREEVAAALLRECIALHAALVKAALADDGG